MQSSSTATTTVESYSSTVSSSAEIFTSQRVISKEIDDSGSRTVDSVTDLISPEVSIKSILIQMIKSYKICVRLRWFSKANFT